MRFLLDTNAVIALVNDPGCPLARRVQRCSPSQSGVSAIVMHELYYGAWRSQRRDHNLAVVDGLQLEILPFDQEDARHAGEIRAVLAAPGKPIGAYDVLIAAQAHARAA